MPSTSYEHAGRHAMPDNDRRQSDAWIDLPAHAAVRDAVESWLGEDEPKRAFRVSGAAGVGKSAWLADFARRKRRDRFRWATASFARGERVTPQALVERWSAELARWVERPARYAQPESARRWVDLATEVLRSEGFRVVRVVEADRKTLADPHPAPLCAGALLLAREPFRGTRFGSHSAVLPVWSHDDLGCVLSRTWPERSWPEETVATIWERSCGHARKALAAAKIMAESATGETEPASARAAGAASAAADSKSSTGIGLFNGGAFLFNK
jgi:hypothetical protein